MRQNQTNMFKFIIALTGLFSALKVYGQTILYSGNQHTADLDNQKYDNAYEMRQQIDSAAKKIINYVSDSEGFPKPTDPAAVDLGEFVATVIPDFRQQSNIASLLYSTYTIIGAGGGGTVIRATRRDNGEEIAVKLTGASDLSFFPMSRYYIMSHICPV